MFQLNLSIIEEKIKAIKIIKFLRNFKNLEINLRFFDYYC